MRILSLALLLGPVAVAQFTAGNLEQNLKSVECDTLLVLKSNLIRDPLHWSPDSKSLGVKVSGNWYGINLDKLMLKRVKWRDGQNIARPTGKLDTTLLTKEVRERWTPAIEEDSTRVQTATGTYIEFLNPEEGGVALVVTFSDGRKRELWRTRLEECKGLVLSPDQRWVAFICGIHGAVVMKVP